MLALFGVFCPCAERKEGVQKDCKNIYKNNGANLLQKLFFGGIIINVKQIYIVSSIRRSLLKKGRIMLFCVFWPHQKAKNARQWVLIGLYVFWFCLASDRSSLFWR